MKNAKTVIIAFLLGVTVFCVYKYIVSVKENYDLSGNIRRLNTDIKALEDEKNGLVKDLNREREINKALGQENSWSKDNLNQTQVKLSRLEADYQSSQKAIEELSSQTSLVKAENTALRDQIQSLEIDINQAKVDKEQLKSRLSSIVELKKAIKELRSKTRQIKKQVKRRIEEKQDLILGNSGFLVKEGQPTGKNKIKIEVEPLPGS